MRIADHPLRSTANGTARTGACRGTSTRPKLRNQSSGLADDKGIEPALTEKDRPSQNRNEMTHNERVTNIPKLVTILDDGLSAAFREVLTEILADIASRPLDLLLLMKPTRRNKRVLPPRLNKLLERAEDEVYARGSRMSGSLRALVIENGIMPDRIVSLRMDAPGIAVQVGDDDSSQALIVCEGGEWQIHLFGPRFPNGGMVPFESAVNAVRIVAILAADFV
jgi:hypothetical protein